MYMDMDTEQQYAAIRNNSTLQLSIHRMLGELARDYVLHKKPNAVALYTANEGIKTYVGIYLTKGLEVTSRGNFYKEQYPVILISKLIRCSAPHDDNELSYLNTYAWVSAMEILIAANGEKHWKLDWLKKMTSYFGG